MILAKRPRIDACLSTRTQHVVRLSDRTTGQVGFARETEQESIFGGIEREPTGPPAFRDRPGSRGKPCENRLLADRLRSSSDPISDIKLISTDTTLSSWPKGREAMLSRRERKSKKAYGTWYSQAVTHPSTNQARRCLTSVIGREPVLST